MRTFPDLRMHALAEDPHRAQQLLDQNQHAEACEVLASVRAPFAIPATSGPAC